MGEKKDSSLASAEETFSGMDSSMSGFVPQFEVIFEIIFNIFISKFISNNYFIFLRRESRR